MECIEMVKNSGHFCNIAEIILTKKKSRCIQLFNFWFNAVNHQ